MTTYYGKTVTSKQLFLQHAPDFNFELNEAELLNKALESGFIFAIPNTKNSYKINPDY